MWHRPTRRRVATSIAAALPGRADGRSRGRRPHAAARLVGRPGRRLGAPRDLSDRARPAASGSTLRPEAGRAPRRRPLRVRRPPRHRVDPGRAVLRPPLCRRGPSRQQPDRRPPPRLDPTGPTHTPSSTVRARCGPRTRPRSRRRRCDWLRSSRPSRRRRDGRRTPRNATAEPRSGYARHHGVRPGSTTARWRRGARTSRRTATSSTALERDLAEHGLTLGDYQVLVYLSEADDGSMRMCDLADVLQLSPSGLTRRLDGLVASEHVVRRPSPHDGRVMMAVLTDAGRDLLTGTAPHHVASVRRHIFDHLTAEQVDAMASIFEAISAGLAAPSSRPATSPEPAATMTTLPRGFTQHVANIGIKDDTDDFVVVTAERPVPCAALFTKSRFAGPSVILSRDHVSNGRGAGGGRDLEELQRGDRASWSRRRRRGRRRRRRPARVPTPLTSWSRRPVSSVGATRSTGSGPGSLRCRRRRPAPTPSLRRRA